MPADPTVCVEYVVRCARFETKPFFDIGGARISAKTIDAEAAYGPVRVIKRTITEEDVTE